MDERLKFIARLLDEEKMAVACRQFGIQKETQTREPVVGDPSIVLAYYKAHGDETSASARPKG